MVLPALFPNHLSKERAGLGLTVEAFAERCEIDARLYRQMEEGRFLPDHSELDRIIAVLGGVDPKRIFDLSLINTIGDTSMKQPGRDYQAHFDSYEEGGRLLVTPDELEVLDRGTARPDRAVDVFVNMSCGTQRVPHLMLDIINVLRALDIDVAAGAGRRFCCGTLYKRNEHWDASQRMREASLSRALAWNAPTVAHMCTQCANTFTEASHREAAESGRPQTVSHTQVLRLIDERLAELGDRVPWKKAVNARILAHGHSKISFIHHRAKQDVGHIASRIPGVEFVGFLDPISIDSFCMPDPGLPKRPKPRTREETAQYRAELAEVARSWGADTISPQHQGCYMFWMPFESETVAVRHIVGILAEALGVASPNRFQAASRLGDPKAVVEHTRPVWTSWGMTQEKALEIANGAFGDPSATVDRCSCGKSDGDRCGYEDLITPVSS